MKCINDILEEFYARYAFLVYRYAWAFIIGPVALTVCLSTGFMFMTERTVNETSYMMTPRNGPSYEEAAAFMRHWRLTEESEDEYVPHFYVDSKHYLNIFITAKPDHNLFDYDVLDEIQALDDAIESKYTLRGYDDLTNFTYFTYESICLSWKSRCFSNGHIYLLRHRHDQGKFGVDPPRLTWPITRETLTGTPYYLGSLIAKPVFNKSDNDTLINAKYLGLNYFTRQLPGKYEIYNLQWRVGIIEYLKSYSSDLIDIAFGNEDTLNQGLVDTANKYFPDIIVTVGLVFAFCYVCSFFLMHRKRPKFVGIDWVRSKPMLAVVGVMEPALAIASSVGLLLLLGIEFNSIIVPMPFIVLAIGVDDMFIMIASWHSTKLTDPPQVRFSHALSDAAVAISITAITDVISFSVGTWNPLPGVQLFCLYTAVAMFFELIYQCTFYAAFLALMGKAEYQGRHCITWRKAIAFEDAKTKCDRTFKVGTIITKSTSTVVQNALATTKPDSPPVVSSTPASFDYEEGSSYVQKFFRDTYGPVLLHPAGKATAGLIFLVYLATASWGCAGMESGLQPEKLIYEDHYAVKYLKGWSNWDDGQQVMVLLENPPNITLNEERKKMLELASAFENSTYSFGSEGTLFWLREYLRFLNSSSAEVMDTQEQWCVDLKNWLKGDTDGFWYLSIVWANQSMGEDQCKIKAFRFFIAAKQGTHPSTQVLMVPFFRGVAARYSQYKVYTFNVDIYPYADQYLIINTITIRNSIVAFFVMIVVSMILIPHPVCALFITFATVSIDIGVCGYLSWWGVNMDCVSMITMIMATGIAIDLAAHVSYAYVRADGTPHERAIKALESLGWPVFQGVTAMLLGVLVLATADSYMYKTFFKTVFLVILFGLMHSIIFLPVALTVLAPQQCIGCCWKKATSVNKRSRVALAASNGVAAPARFQQT